MFPPLEMIHLCTYFVVRDILCSEDDLVSVRSREDVVSAGIWDSAWTKTRGKYAFSGPLSIQFISKYVQKL